MPSVATARTCSDGALFWLAPILLWGCGVNQQTTPKASPEDRAEPVRHVTFNVRLEDALARGIQAGDRNAIAAACALISADDKALVALADRTVTLWASRQTRRAVMQCLIAKAANPSFVDSPVAVFRLQTVTFLNDGADAARFIVMHMTPESSETRKTADLMMRRMQRALESRFHDDHQMPRELPAPSSAQDQRRALQQRWLVWLSHVNRNRLNMAMTGFCRLEFW